MHMPRIIHHSGSLSLMSDLAHPLSRSCGPLLLARETLMRADKAREMMYEVFLHHHVIEAFSASEFPLAQNLGRL
jgi:hypothetical protein